MGLLGRGRCTTDVVRIWWPPQVGSPHGLCTSLRKEKQDVELSPPIKQSILLRHRRRGCRAHLWLQGLPRPKRYGPAGFPATLPRLARSSHRQFARPSVHLRQPIAQPLPEDTASLERPTFARPSASHARALECQALACLHAPHLVALVRGHRMLQTRTPNMNFPGPAEAGGRVSIGSSLSPGVSIPYTNGQGSYKNGPEGVGRRAMSASPVPNYSGSS